MDVRRIGVDIILEIDNAFLDYFVEARQQVADWVGFGTEKPSGR